jgi:hypothetical protein
VTAAAFVTASATRNRLRIVAKLMQSPLYIFMEISFQANGVRALGAHVDGLLNPFCWQYSRRKENTFLFDPVQGVGLHAGTPEGSKLYIFQ